MKDKLSLIIPCYNEENYIIQCLESIKRFDYDKRLLEIIIVDGNSTDKTQVLIKSFIKNNADLNVLYLVNFDKFVPISLNMAINVSTSKYIVRLDAHSLYPENYLSELYSLITTTGAYNVGSACKTVANSGDLIPQSIVFVLSDKLGVGNSVFRLAGSGIHEVDTVPFGFFKKEVFSLVGFFNERLQRNQDIELNSRIKEAGLSILINSDLQLQYLPATNFKDFIIKNFENGKWNILTAKITGKLSRLSFRHFMPLIFVLFLLIMLFTAFFLSSVPLVCCIVLYLVILFANSLLRGQKFFQSIVNLLSYSFLHIPYGLGSLVGVFRSVKP